MSIEAALARELIGAAHLAPSSHNTQPWRFRIIGGAIELRADRGRRLPANDPEDRELTISCGAALFNLETAAAAAGRPVRVRPFPVAGDPDLLAVVESATSEVSVESHLAGMIPVRRTHRGPFTDATPAEAVLTDLQGVVRQHDAQLRWVLPGGERTAVAELVAAGDRSQFADPGWRRELASWMRTRRAGDGLALPWWSAPITRRVVSHLDLGARTARQDQAAILAAPAVAVLTTPRDRPESWLEAGRALEHLLLTAAGHGLQAGYANQPCQVARLRPRLRDRLGLEGGPQLVLRLGAAPVRRRAPRRPVDDVLTTSAEGSGA
jgi:nitroreductase